MSGRAELLVSLAALCIPAAFYPLLVDPKLGIVVALAAVAVFLASRSLAYPVALVGLPAIVIALAGSNPLPQGLVTGLMFAWMALALVLALLREERGLPARALLSAPVVCSFALAALMLARLGVSPAGSYGGHKLQLFLIGNLTVLIAGILVGRRSRHFDLFVVLTLAVAAASSIVLVEQLAGGHAVTSVGGRFALSPEANPIHLGRGAALGLIASVYVLLGASALWLRLAAIAVLPLAAVALAAAGSRGPVLGLVVGLVVLLALLLRDPATRRRTLLVALGALAAAILVPQLVPGEDIGRSFSFLAGSGSGVSSNGRFDLWSSAAHAFASHPFLGLGTGAFAALQPVELYPHDLGLEVAAELGLAGLVLLAGILVPGAVRLARAWRDAPADERARPALALAFFSCALVNALFSGDIQTNSTLWLMLGIGVGLSLRTWQPATVTEPARTYLPARTSPP